MCDLIETRTIHVSNCRLLETIVPSIFIPTSFLSKSKERQLTYSSVSPLHYLLLSTVLLPLLQLLQPLSRCGGLLHRRARPCCTGCNNHCNVIIKNSIKFRNRKFEMSERKVHHTKRETDGAKNREQISNFEFSYERD